MAAINPMFEKQVLDDALNGRPLLPRNSGERDLMIEFLKEAEGRAAEFDHYDRADKFRAAHLALAKKKEE